jgi:AraC-like DNA-binding protein
VSGSASYHLGKYEGTLSSGDYFVVDYNTSHDYLSSEKDLTLINCLFLPEFVHETMKGVGSFNELCERYFMRITGRKINGPAANQIFKGTEKTGELFSDMLNEYTEKNEGYLQVIRFLLCRIIIETVREIGSRKNISSVTEEVIEIIEKNFREKLSLARISKEMHYSLPYISAIFKKETGFSFTDYLQNRRLEETCRLLRETELPVSTVAESVGYQNVKFFGKLFKRFTGLSPREYRKK